MDNTRPESFAVYEQKRPHKNLKKIAASFSLLTVFGSLLPITTEKQHTPQIASESVITPVDDQFDINKIMEIKMQIHDAKLSQQAEARKRLQNFSAWVSAVSRQQPAIRNHPLYEIFEELSNCESGEDWSINTGNGYYGGVQFAQSTWVAMDGQRFAERADLASKDEQIAVAIELQNEAGWDQWPTCARQLGLY